MATPAERILGHLAEVARLRQVGLQDPAFAAAVQALKTFQARRFERSYVDLLADTRMAPAARFFLTDLYGPGDFSRRDAEFGRIVPALVRLFEAEVVETVAALAELHALSEGLDADMARAVGGQRLDGGSYRRAWGICGRSIDRQRQIALTLRIGQDLSRLTRRRLLRGALHLMRGPAHAAGLGTLQSFLERGFDTFGAMGGDATRFLDTIEQRENALARALFRDDVLAPELRWLDAPAVASGNLGPALPR
ncbi:MAG: FFLEELY motif protein [Aquabacterium sp.]